MKNTNTGHLIDASFAQWSTTQAVSSFQDHFSRQMHKAAHELHNSRQGLARRIRLTRKTFYHTFVTGASVLRTSGTRFAHMGQCRTIRDSRRIRRHLRFGQTICLTDKPFRPRALSNRQGNPSRRCLCMYYLANRTRGHALPLSEAHPTKAVWLVKLPKHTASPDRS